MSIPYAKTYTATTSGVALREVNCEYCQAEFVYLLSRDASGAGTSLFFLDNDGARQRSLDEANSELTRVLHEEIDPVPCPQCGRYQGEMIPLIKAKQHRWIIGVAVIFLFTAFIALMALRYHSVRFHSEKTLLGIGVAGGIVCGLGLLLWRQIRIAAYDPNAMNHDESIKLGRHHAMLRAEFERDGPGQLFAPIRDKQRKHEWLEARVITFFLFGTASLFIVGSSVFLYLMREEVIDGFGSSSWPTAKATLISAALGIEHDSGRGRQSTIYLPNFRYKYRVDGQEYTGSRYRLDPVKSQNQKEMLSLLATYQNQPEFQVRFKPTDPAICVIIPGLTEWRIASILLLVGALLFGLGWFAYEFNRYRKIRREFFAPQAH